jgi:drug/metabolite transporter (DMT)-like permease
VGIVLLVTALIMINYQKSDEKTPKTTWKWWLFVLLAFFGNGMCSIVQRLETERYGDEGRNTFMIVALAMVCVTLIVVSLCMREERSVALQTVKKGWAYALACGVANGLVNFLVIYLNAKKMNASVMFPVISAAHIVLAFVYSVLVCKERFNLRQRLGFLLGVVSIVLLNL